MTICRRVRAGLTGEHAVGRVIARPFAGADGAFERTDGRRDFSLAPPVAQLPQELQGHGVPVHAVGKVGQLFAGVGHRRRAPGRDQRARPGRDHRADRRARPRLRVHQPDRDRPGLRPPPRLRRLRRGAAPDRRARRRAGWSCCAPTTCWCSPPTTAATSPRRAPTTRASTRRCWPASPATAAAATTGSLADVGASVLAGWLAGARRAGAARALVPVACIGASMPELPEVETIRRQLAPHLEGRTIARGRDPRSPLDAARRAGARCEAELRGRVVEEVGRSGKYLVWRLSGRALPAHAPAHDRRAAVRPAGRPAAHPRALRARRRPPARLQRPAALRHRAPGHRRRRARRLPGAAARGSSR